MARIFSLLDITYVVSRQKCFQTAPPSHRNMTRAPQPRDIIFGILSPPQRSRALHGLTYLRLREVVAADPRRLAELHDDERELRALFAVSPRGRVNRINRVGSVKTALQIFYRKPLAESNGTERAREQRHTMHVRFVFVLNVVGGRRSPRGRAAGARRLVDSTRATTQLPVVLIPI